MCEKYNDVFFFIFRNHTKNIEFIFLYTYIIYIRKKAKNILQ